jgi:hypothetical protein
VLDEHGSNTDVTLEMNYQVPVPVLGKIKERAAHANGATQSACVTPQSVSTSYVS